MSRLCLLQIRRLDFASIWIRCPDFIYITFGSIVVQTFRLRLLQIRSSDFPFIHIRCSNFICITSFPLQFRRSDFVFYKKGHLNFTSTFYILNKGIHALPLCFFVSNQIFKCLQNSSDPQISSSLCRCHSLTFTLVHFLVMF